MRSMRLVALIAAIALAIPTAASAARKTYGGTTDGGGQIALDVVVSKKGKVKRVTEIRAINLPSICEVSGQLTTYTALPGPLGVVAKEFSAIYTQPTYLNESTVEGRFTGKKNVSGTLSFSYHFLADAQFPEEDCDTGPLGFRAKRNGPDAILPPAERPGTSASPARSAPLSG